MTESSPESNSIPQTENAKKRKKDNNSNNKKESVPSDGYVCKLCNIPGHWIQQCPNEPQEKHHRRKNKKKKKANHHHEYQEGIDPSPQDIALAKKMQQLTPPLCTCGQPSRIKKVKKSNINPNSRANGSYFFFCSKKKHDPTKCSFVQLATTGEGGNESQQTTSTNTNTTAKEKSQANFFARKRKGLL